MPGTRSTLPCPCTAFASSGTESILITPWHLPKKPLVQLPVAAEGFNPIADLLGNVLRVLPEAPHPGLPGGAEELPGDVQD